MNEYTAKEKIAIGRGIVKKKMRYFESALMGLMPTELPGLKTTAVSENMVLYYDPDTLAEWDIEETSFAIAHELSHVIRNHIGRAKAIGINPTSEDAIIWNYAGDAVINHDLSLAGFKVYDKDTTYAKLGITSVNMTVEEVYAFLKKEKWTPPSSPRLGAGNCGSCSGHKHQHEPDNEKSGVKGRSNAEIVRIRKQTADAIQQASKDKRAGTIPGGWIRWAGEEVEVPKIPWSIQFARTIRKGISWSLGAVDYKYNGISRRQGGLGFGMGKPVLPKLRSPNPDVLVVVDASGSMGTEELKKAVIELKGIVQATGIPITFMTFDTEVHTFEKIISWKKAAKTIKGGGGTNFNPIFKKVLEMKKKPAVIVLMTDGYSDYFPAVSPIPGIPVICLLINSKHRPCNWWTYIEVE